MKMSEISLSFRREGDLPYVRKKVRVFSEEIGLEEEVVESTLLGITELLTNVTKYAGGLAFINIRSVQRDSSRGIEVTVEDRGRGIQQLGLALTDGFSSKGTLGLGLGAVRRLSDEFEVENRPDTDFEDSGLRVTFRKFNRSNISIRTGTSNRMTGLDWWVESWCESKGGTPYNGDGVFWIQDEGLILAAVIDGVGHGRTASEVTQTVIRVIKASSNDPLDHLVEIVHSKVGGSIGCQMGLIRIDKRTGILRYVIVGNIRGFHLHGNRIFSLLSKSGTVGRTLPTLMVQEVVVKSGDMLVLHSDGISRGWVVKVREKRYPGFTERINGDFLMRYAKDSDDSSFMIIGRQ